MGLGDKIQETVGKAKEGLGDALDNEKLRGDGQKDRLEANAKEAGEHVNEKVGDATASLADKVEDATDRFTRDDNK